MKAERYPDVLSTTAARAAHAMRERERKDALDANRRRQRRHIMHDIRGKIAYIKSAQESLCSGVSCFLSRCQR